MFTEPYSQREVSELGEANRLVDAGQCAWSDQPLNQSTN